MEDSAMTLISTLLTWIISAAVALAAAQEPAAKPQRFDYLVRADFFAGVAGDAARLQNVIDLCERALEQNPQHPEAMVWHGATVVVRAAQAFQKGDAPAGQSLFARGVNEMTDAVALAPNNPGVLIPRGAVLFEATRGMPPEMAKPLVQSAVANYERALEVQAPTFASLGDHAKGELLFGLADGWARLGDTQKAREYFERLIADAPTSGQVIKAREWIATGVVPKSNGSSCVGCHK
jgi:tetratricopeptide (TPR) repeat protein